MEDLFKQVKKLVEQGYGRAVIQRELGITQRMAEQTIKKVREKYPNIPPAGTSRNRELHNDRHHNTKYVPPLKAAKKKKLLKKVDKMNKLEKVEYLMEQEDMGCRQIANLINEPENSISQLINKKLTKPKRLTRAQKLEELMDSGETDAYELAKRMGTSPARLKTFIAQKEGKYCPAGDWIKKAVKDRGVKLSTLTKQLGKLTLERAKEILQENYRGHFIVHTNLPDGDTLLTPVMDNSKKFEWLNIDTSLKKFKYYVNDDENYMTVEFDEDLPEDEITIINLTDIHIGAKAFRKKEFQAAIDMIAREPNLFFVTGGDLYDAVTKASVGDQLDQYESINEQVVESVTLLKPIAHKCIAMMAGNHCQGRTLKAAQVDLARIVAQMLQIPYFQVRTTIDMFFRGVNKRMSLTHNYGKAIQMPQVVNEVKKLVASLNYRIDCFTSGHNHLAFLHAFEVTDLLPGQGYVQRRCYIANGGSFVKYTGSYAEKAGYGMTPQDLVYFTFNDEGDYSAGQIPLNSV